MLYERHVQVFHPLPACDFAGKNDDADFVVLAGLHLFHPDNAAPGSPAHIYRM